MTIETKAREWAEEKYPTQPITTTIESLSYNQRNLKNRSVAINAYLAGAAGAMEWVPVSERLPEKNGYYICWLEYPSEHGLIHYHASAGWQNGFYNEKVTHWFYLIPPHPEK